jgi:hypothetical protein
MRPSLFPRLTAVPCMAPSEPTGPIIWAIFSTLSYVCLRHQVRDLGIGEKHLRDFGTIKWSGNSYDSEVKQSTVQPAIHAKRSIPGSARLVRVVRRLKRLSYPTKSSSTDRPMLACYSHPIKSCPPPMYDLNQPDFPIWRHRLVGMYG